MSHRPSNTALCLLAFWLDCDHEADKGFLLLDLEWLTSALLLEWTIILERANHFIVPLAIRTNCSQNITRIQCAPSAIGCWLRPGLEMMLAVDVMYLEEVGWMMDCAISGGDRRVQRRFLASDWIRLPYVAAFGQVASSADASKFRFSFRFNEIRCKNDVTKAKPNSTF